MKIWLDDIRDPKFFGHDGWHWVRTAEEAIVWLADQEIEIEEISLDHDLSWPQMQAGMVGLVKDDGQKSGYDVVLWLEAHPDRWPGMTYVHSANPASRARMQQVIDKHYHHSLDSYQPRPWEPR